MTLSAPPPRIRIYSYITPDSFLHIENAGAIGKLRLFGGAYLSGNGTRAMLSHYVDIADMRVLCHALLHRYMDYNYVEHKGTVHSPTTIISRTLRLHTRTEKVWVEFISGPGTLTPTGAILLKQSPVRPIHVNVGVDWHSAQALAYETLAFLHAWDVARLLHHQAQVNPLPAYPIYTPPTHEPEVIVFSDSPDEATLLPTTLLTSLRYKDGTLVNPAHATEGNAFNAYVRAMGKVPDSRNELKRWLHTRRPRSKNQGAPR
jgi:hypothetical protein